MRAGAHLHDAEPRQACNDRQEEAWVGGAQVGEPQGATRCEFRDGERRVMDASEPGNEVRREEHRSPPSDERPRPLLLQQCKRFRRPVASLFRGGCGFHLLVVRYELRLKELRAEVVTHERDLERQNGQAKGAGHRGDGSPPGQPRSSLQTREEGFHHLHGGPLADVVRDLSNHIGGVHLSKSIEQCRRDDVNMGL